MKISDLLAAMQQAASKARDVACIIRSEPALLHLLVEEKKGEEKNKRFVQDFKTLADVLIQEMVSHDIAMQVCVLFYIHHMLQHIWQSKVLIFPENKNLNVHAL